MKVKKVSDSILIHEVPFVKTTIDNRAYELVIEFDDSLEIRQRAIFHSYYAFRMVCTDCSKLDFIDETMEIGLYKRYIWEVIDSDWIKELKDILHKRKCEDDETDRVRHFIFDAGDYIIEVIASKIEIISGEFSE